jgi:hypothetical protein
MEDLIKQIQRGLEANLYLLALYAALPLPDICGAIESLDGLSTGQKYRDWYNRYVFPKYSYLTADECYDFRCRVLHQGQTRAKKANSYYSHVAFAEPGLQRPKLNFGSSGIQGQSGPGPKSIELVDFINAVLFGVITWQLEKKGSEPFDKNMRLCLRRHEEGIAGLLTGVPYIY